jgi:hypothetical protein
MEPLRSAECALNVISRFGHRKMKKIQTSEARPTMKAGNGQRILSPGKEQGRVLTSRRKTNEKR